MESQSVGVVEAPHSIPSPPYFSVKWKGMSPKSIEIGTIMTSNKCNMCYSTRSITHCSFVCLLSFTLDTAFWCQFVVYSLCHFNEYENQKKGINEYENQKEEFKK